MAQCAEPRGSGEPKLPSGHAGEVKSASATKLRLAGVVGFRVSIRAGSGGRPYSSLGHTRSKETYSCGGLDGGGGDGRRGFPSSFVSNICISLFNCSYRINRSVPFCEGSSQRRNVLLRKWSNKYNGRWGWQQTLKDQYTNRNRWCGDSVD